MQSSNQAARQRHSFFAQTFDDFEIDSNAENPIAIDEEQDKENSPPPLPSKPASERTTQTPVFKRSSPLWKKN